MASEIEAWRRSLLLSICGGFEHLISETRRFCIQGRRDSILAVEADGNGRYCSCHSGFLIRGRRPDVHPASAMNPLRRPWRADQTTCTCSWLEHDQAWDVPIAEYHLETGQMAPGSRLEPCEASVGGVVQSMQATQNHSIPIPIHICMACSRPDRSGHARRYGVQSGRAPLDLLAASWPTPGAKAKTSARSP